MSAAPVLPSADTLEAIVDDMQLAMAETVGAPASEPDGDGALVEAAVDVLGESPCRVVVRYPRSGARGLAGAMFDRAVADLEESDVLDAVGEVANIVAGGVKSLSDDASSLGLPQAHVEADAAPLALDPSHATTVGREWNGHTLEVHVLAAAVTSA